jgi:hypothetical protein
MCGAPESACCCCLLCDHDMSQLLGLLLPKYVPDETLLRQPSWVGVVHHADALEAMLQQHVIEPLLQGKLGCASVPTWSNTVPFNHRLGSVPSKCCYVRLEYGRSAGVP